jgi:hypothetical protein
MAARFRPAPILLVGAALLLGALPARGARGEDRDDSRPLAASEQEALIASFNRWASGVRSVRAGGKARVGAESEKPRAFQFSLVLARPGQARLQGRWGSLATIFDLSGDPAGWTLYLPQDRSVVRAPRGADAGPLLPPAEILAVLLPMGIPPRDLDREGAGSREGDLARLVVPPGKGGAGSPFHRVLWLDPENGTPRRLEIRQASQLEAPLLVAEYGRYEGKGADAFPAEVSVTMSGTGEWARFRFDTVRLNGEVAASTFTLSIPAGTREVAPEALTPDFLPVEETP